MVTQLCDHLDAIYSHINQHIFDFVIVNEGIPPLEILKQYAEEGAVPVRPDLERLLSYGCELIVDNLLLYRSVLRHDAGRLSWHIMRLLKVKRAMQYQGMKEGIPCPLLQPRRKSLPGSTPKRCCHRAELSALVRMNGVIQIGHETYLGVRTENAATARRIFFIV